MSIMVSLFSQAPTSYAATGVMDDPIYQGVNPTSSVSFLTPYMTEITNAAEKYGYTEHDTLFLASMESGTGLVAAKRLYRSSGSDFVTEADQARINLALQAGYVDQGTRFYVSLTATSQSKPVYRFIKNNKHRYALSPSDQSALEAAGWAKDGISFYAVPTPQDAEEFGDGKFGIAIMPDTQQEVYASAGDQFEERTRWIAAKKSEYDLRFVGHTGDIISWGGNTTQPTGPSNQFPVASTAFNNIDTMNVPYLLAVGNHDGAAVCEGGSACPGYTGAQVNAEIRNTTELNRFFPTTRVKPSGVYQEGKIDNAYTLFEAEGTKWMVLTIELWPRQAVLDWAKSIVTQYSDRNVIVLSHSLLDANGNIYNSNGGYGNLPSNQIYEQLLLQYPNIKMAFSGHTGQAKYLVSTNTAKNVKMVTFLGAFHQDNYNPTRMVTIDVNNGTITSDIQAASIRDDYLAANPGATLPTYNEYDVTITGMTFIR